MIMTSEHISVNIILKPTSYSYSCTSKEQACSVNRVWKGGIKLCEDTVQPNLFTLHTNHLDHAKEVCELQVQYIHM